MLNQKDLKEMKTEFLNYDKYRELVIKKSRDVLKLSKQIIYAVHRDNLKEAGFKVIDGPVLGRRSPSTIAINAQEN